MPNHAASAYSLTQQRTADPRQLEAALLLVAAARLQHLRDNMASPVRRHDLDSAIAFNAKLWAIFLASAMRQRRLVPDRVHDDIAELALAVFATSARLVARRPAEEAAPDPGHDIGALIEINRIVAIALRAP
ncbi:MAG: flagellar biosynthesis regulator FlaF [Bradyrhizobium sp.]|nr:flagellar biosynthesis regulator FlaF [Bradyrhizobium sp.]